MRLVTPLTPDICPAARSASIFWKLVFDLTLERYPAFADRHVHFASRNSRIPLEGVDYSSSNKCGSPPW